MITAPTKRQPIPFGKYLLLDRINIGGMAEVWRAKRFEEASSEQLVAIKRILPNIAEDEEFIAMFIDEAKISAQLNHANIARISDLGLIAHNYFIEVEYIPGKDMRAIFDRCRKRGEPAPVPLVVYCVAKMCEALDYAHRKKDSLGREMNIVHRDVSPQNVLISYEGEVKVIDFGIAKAAGKATRTQAGILKGKFGYMSPEQVRGGLVDGRSDIFAIGICLYELLTGERLFVGESDYAVLEKVRKAEIPPPSALNPKISEPLEKMVLKALRRELDQRYQRANELADDLHRFLLSSEQLFTQRNLAQYMRETFAEEVEREAQRLSDYMDVKAPPEVLAAASAGYSVPDTAVNAPAPVDVRMNAGEAQRRSASLTALPRLSSSPALPEQPPLEDPDDPRNATVMVDSGSLFDGAATSDSAAAPKAKDSDDTARDVSLPAMVTEHIELPTPTFTLPPPPPVEVLAPPAEAEPLDAVLIRLPRRMLAMGAGAFVALILLVAWWVREPPVGFLMVDLPQEMRAEARVSLNGEDLGIPTSWPWVQRTHPGPNAVRILAPGYLPFEQSVEVIEGQQVTAVNAVLQAKGAGAPSSALDRVALRVVTQPAGAELKVNGQIVRALGNEAPFVGELPRNVETLVEARAPGYQQYLQRLTPTDASPVHLTAQLRVQ